MKGKTIVLFGPAESGKSTVANMIREVTNDNTVSLAFADPLKEFSSSVFGFPPENLYGSSNLRNYKFTEFASPERWHVATHKLFRFAPEWSRRVLLAFNEAPVHLHLLDTIVSWYHNLRTEALDTGGLSVRRTLQTLGTECGRSVCPDIWAKYGFYHSDMHLLHGTRLCVITDGRFLNEARLARTKGAEVVAVSRPLPPSNDNSSHISESEVTSAEMAQYITYTVDNSDTLADLRNNVKVLVQTLA